MEIIGDPEDLEREILADARKESAALLAAAGAEAAGIMAAAQARASGGKNAALEAARAEGARRREMLLASVPSEAAGLRAARMEGLLAAVKGRTRALLAAEASGTALASLAAEAAAGIGGDSFVFSAAPGSGLQGLAAEIGRMAGLGPVELRFEEDPEMTGGVIARSADGRRRWDNSLDGRLERIWPELRREIAAELAGGGKV